MRENKVFQEFLQNTYDKDKNFEFICSEIKGGIDMKRKILNMVAVLLVVILIGATSSSIYAKISWNIEYKEFQNRLVKTDLVAIDEATTNGYAENLNMEYIYQDGIGIKLNSLMMTNDYFEIYADIKLPEDLKINPDLFGFGYAIYDENKNVYALSERIKMYTKTKNKNNYYKKFYKELNIKYNPKDIYGGILSNSSQGGTDSYVKGNLIQKLFLTSMKGFPQSKKIYIRIFDLGYAMVDIDQTEHKITTAEDINVSNNEWQFEINVPEKFYERETINLKLEKEVNGVKLNKAELTETGLKLNVEVDGYRDLIMSGKDMTGEEFAKIQDESIFITDKDNNSFKLKNSATDGTEKGMDMIFDVPKNDLTKGLYLNVNINNINEKIKLIEK